MAEFVDGHVPEAEKTRMVLDRLSPYTVGRSLKLFRRLMPTATILARGVAA
jgi:hypothetical protein